MIYHQPHNSTGNYSYNAFIYDNVDYTAHFHRNFELIYVISGQVDCVIGGKRKAVTAGEYALCLPYEVHSLASVNDSQCWVGVFAGDFVPGFEKQTRNKTGNKFEFCCESSIHNFLLENLIKEEEPSRYLLMSCLNAVCYEYCNQVVLEEQTNKSGLLMREITDYISQNYREEISLSTLAERVGYNYYYLSKCFRRIFQMSFTEFLNSYRLEEALLLLTESDKDIAEIALESGFQSIRNFNVFFKAHIGTTPQKYRVDMCGLK